jgi:hypothetical protein
MLAFYGLEMRATVPLTVVRSSKFIERSDDWITPSNHNHLRITRILKSLRLLGLESRSAAFLQCLSAIYHEELGKEIPGISAAAFAFWQSTRTEGM